MVKKIHYIWLGQNPKSKVITRCIKSWKKYMPDWEIIEWNESNLNIDINEYARQAYDAKKYAFVSDVLRFNILYNEGGLYFDTDVKLLKSLEPLMKENDAFSGFENGNKINPGLVLYAKQPGNKIFGQMLDLYSNIKFINSDGSFNLKVVGDHFYDILEKYGIKLDNTYQTIDSMTIFPSEYFCPTNGINSISNFTENTHSVHLYAASWVDKKKRRKDTIKKVFYTVFGTKLITKMKKIIGWSKEK